MPVNITNWDDYVNQLTNHQHILAQQIIHTFNQTYKTIKQKYPNGIVQLPNPMYNKIKKQIAIDIKQQTQRVISTWVNALNPNQSQKFQQIIGQLTSLNEIIDQQSLKFSFYMQNIDYQAYLDYYANYFEYHDYHIIGLNHLKIQQAKSLFEWLMYVETELNYIIENK